MLDPQCVPNVISYSAVMTACCMGGHPFKAEEWFHRMRLHGVAPDHICYSTLIAGAWLPAPPSSQRARQLDCVAWLVVRLSLGAPNAPALAPSAGAGALLTASWVWEVPGLWMGGQGQTGCCNSFGPM